MSILVELKVVPKIIFWLDQTEMVHSIWFLAEISRILGC